MKTIYIKDVPELEGQEVMLYGWVHIKRDHKKVVFIDLRDRSGIVQVVGDEKMAILNSEDVVAIKGIVKKRSENFINPKIKTGTVEIAATDFEVLTKAKTLPFDFGKDKLDLTLPVLLDNRGLTLRHPSISPIFKVQEVVIDSFRNALKNKDFIEFQAPVIISQAAEGGAEVFEIKYFDHKAYLAQSPQFYKQIMVAVFERVFTVNKTLRAEPSVTTRHLTEATTLDAEFGFIDSWLEVMNMAEYTIRFMLEEVYKNCADIVADYGVERIILPEKIPYLKLREAQEIIFKRTGRDNRHEPDLDPEDEREICEWAKEEKASDLVFITHYPVEKRPFYTYEDPDDLGYTLSFDLLGKGIEWMTGGQRMHQYDLLIDNAKKRGINLDNSELYLQAFRYGMPPEGGFSFGSERIVMKILNLANIREASLFPRDMERVDIHLGNANHEQKDKKS